MGLVASLVWHRTGVDFVHVCETIAQRDARIQEAKRQRQGTTPVFDTRGCLWECGNVAYFERRTSWIPVGWTGGWICPVCRAGARLK